MFDIAGMRVKSCWRYCNSFTTLFQGPKSLFYSPECKRSFRLVKYQLRRLKRKKMIRPEQFIRMALSFPGTEETLHFERIGFKVSGKRMFATYLEKDNTANIFLTPKDQAVFCQMDPKNIYPVPNKWGEKGATTFKLDKVAHELVMEALLSAYNEVVRSKTRKAT